MQFFMQSSYFQRIPNCLMKSIFCSEDLSFNAFFFLFAFFLKFIFGRVGSSLLGVGFLQLRRVGATLRCGARLLTVVASLVAEHGLQAHRLSSCGTWASVVVARGLQSTGPVVVAHGLSCSAACGIFPDQGSNPCSLHWQADS